MFKHLLKNKTLTKAVYDERWAWLPRTPRFVEACTPW